MPLRGVIDWLVEGGGVGVWGSLGGKNRGRLGWFGWCRMRCVRVGWEFGDVMGGGYCSSMNE